MNTKSTYPDHINFIEWYIKEMNNKLAELAKSVENVGNMDLLSSMKISNPEDLSFCRAESIEDIKKRIKYCKSPLELKQLNQKLNTLYKKQKRKR